MKQKRIVLALGGNALQKDTKDTSAQTQLKMVKCTAKSIVNLVEAGHEIAIVHGNGPQVGQIVATYEKAGDNSKMPFPECGAMSQGYIGYHLQQAIKMEMKKRNINKNVSSIITQVLVDENDIAFKNPTKPIGSFYTEKEAKKLEETKGYIMKEDSGRGFRRVVPSPKPIDIVESSTIKHLLEANEITIACGGGGIPVIDKDGKLEGIAAVIDKDLAATKLGKILDADILLILTAVEKVYINFNKPNQKGLDTLNTKEAKKLIKEGHFAAGSMLPKIEAAIEFVKGNPNKKAIITSLDKVKQGLEGTTGTSIVD